MNNIAVVYLIKQFFYRIWAFLEDWYIGGFLMVARRGVDVLEQLDRSVAFKITVKNLFKPLYQDETFVGRVLGFFFRSSRVIIGGFLYGAVIAVFVAAYLIWALIPIYIIFGLRFKS